MVVIERARFGMVPQLWNQRRPLARMLLNPLFPVLIEKEFEPGFLGMVRARVATASTSGRS